MNISPPPLPHGRQNTPSSPPINTTDTLQITVSYKTRTIALRVNDGPIIADLLPDIARRLGILDPSIVYGQAAHQRRRSTLPSKDSSRTTRSKPLHAHA